MKLLEQAKSLPHAPGVYLMKDSHGEVIYVGKANDLQKRVASYFGKESRQRYQVKFLMDRVCGIEPVITQTEKEALLLENNLIKKYRPRYNIQLRDDKTYASLKLTLRDRFPRIYYTRQIKKDGNLYFGPYSSAAACRETADFIERHFRLRTCSDSEFANRSRPCLQYQIHRCEAPCVHYIDERRYAEIVDQVRLFLEGRKKGLLSRLETQMKEEAGREEFEKAAQTRDLVQSLQKTLESQVAERHGGKSLDAIGFYREGERTTVCLLLIREGKIWDTHLFHLKGHEESPDLLTSFINQYYDPSTPLRVDEILLPSSPSSAKLLEEIFTERRGNKVSLIIPRRGKKREILQLAYRNAKEGFERREKKGQEIEEILAILQKTLHLQNFPRRIECFDISNLQGKQPVGSCICFVQGEPFKDGYRKFRIRSAEEPNDYRMMKELLQRRLLHPEWERADLILIDGGKGQLHVVQEIFQELNLTGIDLAALAKARGSERVDKVYLPERKNPVLFRPHSNELHLLMKIRDEAHRFAISYHKKRRQKEFLR